MSWLLVLLACGEVEPSTRPTPAQPQASGQSPASTPVEAAPVARPDRVAARHILTKVRPLERGSATDKDARRRIEEARDRLAAGEDFRDVASVVSEDGSAKRGGWLGVGEYATWVPEFSEAAFALEVGETSDIIQTEFGYHLVQRVAIDERHLLQIVVRYAEAKGAAFYEVTRSEAEARALTDQILAEIEAGMPFDEAARTWSEGPMAARGGDIGVVLRGELGADVDEAVSGLEVGQVSAAVRTPFGFHILKRVE